MTGSIMIRVVDGKMTEGYNHWDFLGLFGQMGLFPGNSFEQALNGLPGLDVMRGMYKEAPFTSGVQAAFPFTLVALDSVFLFSDHATISGWGGDGDRAKFAVNDNCHQRKWGRTGCL